MAKTMTSGPVNYSKKFLPDASGWEFRIERCIVSDVIVLTILKWNFSELKWMKLKARSNKMSSDLKFIKFWTVSEVEDVCKKYLLCPDFI